MLQLLQHLDNGRTRVVHTPAPGPRPGALLIRTSRSLVSAGTERMLVDFGKAGWIGKARQQPEKVRAVLAKLRSNGVAETLRAVRAKLSQPIPLGYCQVGRVVDAGGADWISVGDRAVSNGPHAEVVSVAHGLCAKIPDGVTDEAATFTPLAAIALQGINLLSVQAGDRVVVCGLGLIGQLAVRILRAQGCEVLGLDPDSARRDLAQSHGAYTPVGDPVGAALAWTSRRGVAGVLITASTDSNEIVSQAARSCQRRGRIVLVGVVGLRLNRADFYRNEVSFQVSRSYGRPQPGEVDSADTNFRNVLELMAAGRLRVDDLITHRFPFDQAPSAYGVLADRAALGVVMQYGAGGGAEQGLSDRVLSNVIELGDEPASDGRVRVAMIGAGNFAVRTLLPALTQLEKRPALIGVASAQGVNAVLTAQSFGAAWATTDSDRVLNNDSVDAVFIATRHHDHAARAIDALNAGKHVWVEKPLALELSELEAISEGRRHSDRMVMVGFNRRFAPMAVRLREALNARSRPYRIRMVVNAGRLDPDHWTLDPQSGGGRIVGEGCHFIDLTRYLVAKPITAVRCLRRDKDGQDGGAFEIAFDDASVAVLDYRTDLPPHIPKEVIEVSGEGFSATIHNWSKLTSNGLGGLSIGRFWAGPPQKGHPEALRAFLTAVREGPPPIPWEEILEVSRWAIEMQGMEGEGQRTEDRGQRSQVG